MIRTPETHPDDPVVGHLWRGTYGHDYFCESYDPSCGYWMNSVNECNGEPPRRTNVSERAIHRTFHMVPRDRPYPQAPAV